eukprot:gnl/TRDRNA2_/TRDRNA2_176573_c1_seq2.p1 gnl/TRDRNA2_/TRDRNA2_176573_c1~~gnl/TRDRNA2_/TRDRNA2_176573_c1_seq2.p1  ORF type:complete len:389 (-),score=-22.00 gnl/TRDRNA2_/TRDRNA2_176573_c1_seq2:171-1337(-)
MNHHMYMKLDNGTVWCLPEGYRVEDRSFDDIIFYLRPEFSSKEIETLDRMSNWSYTINGKEYMPGLIGINNMKAHNYVNVILQIIARVRPLRDFFLKKNTYCEKSSLLLRRTGELLKRIWNPRQFKGQVSPHEFLRAVMSESQQKFTIEKEGDPVLFFLWLLNTFQRAVTDDNPTLASTIAKTFVGELEIFKDETHLRHDREKVEVSKNEKNILTPFLILSLDLPPTPLFHHVYDKMQIPQVPLFKLLKKYDSETVHEKINEGLRRYRITRLPDYLVVLIQRFTKNNFFWEKNPSIVNFPLKNLDLKEAIPLPESETSTKYDLIATVSHEGEAERGSYRIYINRHKDDVWYEVQDLVVMEVLPQMVSVSEAYLQVYERRRNIPKNAKC